MTTGSFGADGARVQPPRRNYPLAVTMHKELADRFIGPQLRTGLAEVLEDNGFPPLTEADQIDLQMRLFDFVFGRRTD